jgi:predicted transcriptional regulator
MKLVPHWAVSLNGRGLIQHVVNLNGFWSSTGVALAQSTIESDNRPMTEKEIVLETIRALPDDCSIEEIAERIEFMAAVQKGLDQLDRGEGIPHDEVKRQLASWLTN